MKLVVIAHFLFTLGACSGHGRTHGHNRHNHIGKEEFEALSLCLLDRGSDEFKLVGRDLTSDIYNELNKQWNLRLEVVYPVAYFLPTTTEDVVSVVKCGIKTKIRVIPNSGGQSFEGISYGTNETIVIDFRNMAEMSVEGTGEDACGHIEAGANTGHINAFLWENGGYGIPLGDCQTIAIGGKAIGGGIGYHSTLYGLTMDNVIETEIVDGQGNVHVANQYENPELFWAIRGFGPGYIGIVTRFKVKLFDATAVKMTFLRIFYALEDFAIGWIAMQNFRDWLRENEPTSVWFAITITSQSFNSSYLPLPPGMMIQALHVQDSVRQPEGSENFLKAISDYFPTPARIVRVNLTNTNFIQFVASSAFAPVVLPHPVTGQEIFVGDIGNYYGPFPTSAPLPTVEQSLTFLKLMQKKDVGPRYFKTKEFLVKRTFTLEEMEEVQETILRLTSNNVWIYVNTEEGAVRDVARDATAFVHRDSIWDIAFHYEGSPDPQEVEEGISYLYEIYEAMEFMSGGEKYQNYVDLDIVDHLEENYKEVLGRLIEQKGRLDPENYFVSPLSLPLYKPEL